MNFFGTFLGAQTGCACISLLDMVFVYPLIFAVSHAKPNWVLNTRKRGSKFIKIPDWWQYLQ